MPLLNIIIIFETTKRLLSAQEFCFEISSKKKTRGPWATIRSSDKTAAIANLQMPCNNIICTNLVDFESPMLYTKIQAKRFLSSGEEEFLSVLPYLGMAAILFSGPKQFEQLSTSFRQKAPCEIL